MPPSNEEALLLSVRALYGAIERFDARVAEELAVDRTALRAINALEHDDVGPSDLARILGIRTASVTALLDRLERDGHVRRELSKTDRRKRVLKLSIETRQRAHRLYEQLGRTIVESMGSAEQSGKAAAIIEQIASCFDTSSGQSET